MIKSLTENGWKQRSISFAKNNVASLRDVMSKRANPNVSSLTGCKIPRNALNPLFLEWVDYGK